MMMPRRTSVARTGRDIMRRLIVACFLLFAGGATAQTPGLLQGRISKIDPGRTVVQVNSAGAEHTLKAGTPAVQGSLAEARAGDVVTVLVDDMVTPSTITSVSRVVRPVPFWNVFAALALASGLIAGVSLLVLQGHNPLVGVDRRYSNSQTQLALWFFTVAAVYLAATILRATLLGGDFIGGIGVTGNVIAVTGLSAFSFGAAKVAAYQKADGQLPQEPATTPDPSATDKLTAPAPLPSATRTSADRPRLSDLVRSDDGRADLGDLQMILITLAAIGIFFGQSVWWLMSLPVEAATTLPDVDTAMLSAFGLGHGAYLFKKVATPSG